MATSIEIGYFNKAVNSTKASGFSGTSYSCLLKDPCDIRNPVFTVEGSLGNYNYAKWSTRYYWVDKVISFPNGIFEAHCHLDPLATYQDDIANTKAYALYHSTIINTEADDPRFNPEIVAAKSVINADKIFASTPTLTGGSVIVTTFEAGSGSSNQGIKTYCMDLSTFATMLTNLQNSLYDNIYDIANVRSSVNGQLPQWTDPDQIFNMLGALGTVAIHDIVKALSDMISRIGGFGSWRDNLIKAVYVPFTGIATTGNKNVHLGYLDTGVSADTCDPINIKTKSTSIQIPWDGKCTTYHFLKHSRFQKFQTVCCGGQYAAIDSDLIRDLGAGDSLNIYTAVETMSGDWSAVLTKDSAVNSLRLASFGGNLGIDITGMAGKGGLGMGMNYTMAGFNMAANALTMGAINAGTGTADSFMSVGSGIASQYINTGTSNAPSGISGNGISNFYLNGSTGYNDMSLIGQLTYPYIIDGLSGFDYTTYCQKYGYPCNSVVQLSLDGSYVVCSGAFVECKGNQQDQAYINSVCNSGILLES